ncbi:hypothetical protein [Brevibacterium moorei]|uniref:hypothetical protein n=1 Tax=Brevibacterium moorei TaxID=2968457 RepID=UPI00211C032E|nr:hypothetical protein [Brevibacterium sp. 68QC2CO]MCQ9385095.1 hypothetical protein [Brevibacterium sp. 68QC2CO]
MTLRTRSELVTARDVLDVIAEYAAIASAGETELAQYIYGFSAGLDWAIDGDDEQTVIQSINGKFVESKPTCPPETRAAKPDWGAIDNRIAKDASKLDGDDINGSFFTA